MVVRVTSGQREQGGHRHWRAFVRLVGTAGAAIAGMALLLSLDAAQTVALDRPDPPTTRVVNHTITWARNPEEKARLVEIDQSLMQQCRESRFVVVTLSGTGMEDSHYQANMIQDLVKDLGGCVMYHWYGHSYDAHASALSIEDAIADVTPNGRRKEVVLLGASFGGIAAEDVAGAPVFRESGAIDLKKIIMIATPVDMDDVIQDVFGIPVPAIRGVPVDIPPFGQLVVLGNAINGQRQRGELLEADEWTATFINAAKTRAVLMRSELQRLRKGLLVVQPQIPVDYLASPASDHTIDTDQAYQRLDSVIQARTRYFTIDGGGHDRGWLMSSAGKYNAKIAPILQEMFGSPA